MIKNGIDIIYINKFNNIISNNEILNKMFTKNEIEYYNLHKNIQTLAGIYAAKEAMLKAIGKGINDYSLLDIEINHYETGEPYIILNGKIKKDYSINNLSLSISHDNDYAIAVVSFII